MYRLQNLNVVRFVETEDEKNMWISRGFAVVPETVLVKEPVIEKPIEKPKPVIEPVKKRKTRITK